MTRPQAAATDLVAAFDLGSNTARGLLARLLPDGSALVLMGAQCMTALGRGLSETGALDQNGLASTVWFVAHVLAEWQHPRRVFAVATAAARDASNGDELLAKLHRETGVRAQVISGEEEGRLSFRGALALAPEFADRRPVVVDVGGRSTEMIIERAGELHVASVPVGARLLTEMCLLSDPPTRAETAEARRVARDLLGPALMALCERPVVAVGGTAQAVMLLNRGRRSVGLRDLARVGGRLCRVRLERRWTMMLSDPGRAEIICGGLALLEAIANHASGMLLHLSDGGVREGLLLERTGAARLVRPG